MAFADGLAEYRFLSELYQRDCQTGSLLAEYPSSNSEATAYKNTERYIIHDPYPPPTASLLKVLGPHHLMCGWGNRLPVCSDVPPPTLLLDHWQGLFGDNGVPTWHEIETDVDADVNYITLFPHENVLAKQQRINPDRYYPLHNKTTIGKIDCPQPKILPDVSPPCVIKLSHGYAGAGNFFIYNTQDEQNARQKMAETWPDAEYVVTQVVENIIGDYGAQFYLDRQGNSYWLGVTEQIFNAERRWAGGVFFADDQDQHYARFQSITAEVAAYLHNQGYFGVVGVDILQDKKDNNFLVDLNPRLTGITPFLMISRLFLQQGYPAGCYAPGLVFPGSLEQLIDRADNTNNVRIIIQSAYQNDNTGNTTCHLSVSGGTLAVCKKALAKLQLR